MIASTSGESGINELRRHEHLLIVVVVAMQLLLFALHLGLRRVLRIPIGLVEEQSALILLHLLKLLHKTQSLLLQLIELVYILLVQWYGVSYAFKFVAITVPIVFAAVPLLNFVDKFALW